MRTVVDNLRPMLGDHFQAKDELCPSHLCTSSGTSTATSAAVATAVRTMPSSCSLFAETHHQVTVGSGAEDTGSHQHLILPSSLQHNQQQQQHQLAYQSGHAIRYYPPLMEHYGGGSSLHRYSSLNQKRESVITFSSNHSAPQSHPLKNAYLESLDLEEDKPRIASLLHSTSAHLHYKHKYKGSQVVINNTTYTIDQIVCICQVLQKSDLHKLEKFVYNLPADDSKLSKNELILRARAIAAYHAANYKEVYDILETHNFNMKYHQELQNLWNNAHYKEHEMKRGHPPGAVEKYRIRKKFQFPRTIWDGEEYVYCFKEKNRRILKEFYLKCNLPTQEDKLKLSSQTQLTVVQSKYPLCSAIFISLCDLCLPHRNISLPFILT